jgi:hypothetical protein
MSALEQPSTTVHHRPPNADQPPYVWVPGGLALMNETTGDFTMSNFGSIGFSGVNAGRAHLAVIQGGGGTADNIGAARDASRALGTAPTLQVAAAVASARRTPAGTNYNAGHMEAPRSSHEAGIRAVARQFHAFDEALLPMVLASGVSGEAAASVVAAIKSNPALLAQAERAFDKARVTTA